MLRVPSNPGVDFSVTAVNGLEDVAQGPVPLVWLAFPSCANSSELLGLCDCSFSSLPEVAEIPQKKPNSRLRNFPNLNRGHQLSGIQGLNLVSLLSSPSRTALASQY